MLGITHRVIKHKVENFNFSNEPVRDAVWLHYLMKAKAPP